MRCTAIPVLLCGCLLAPVLAPAGLRSNRAHDSTTPSPSLGPVSIPWIASAAAGEATGLEAGVAHNRGPAVGASEDWSTQVWEQIRLKEYEVTWTEQGLQAPNRAQGLRTGFRSDGIDVAPRTPRQGSWTWGWQTVAWGRERVMLRIPPAAPIANGSRVEYRRAGMVEWYENRDEGIEQGFTLLARPGGQGPLIIKGRVSEDLRAQASRGGDAVDFLDPSGACVLRYGKLVVYDARGARLEARMNVDDGWLSIAIDDRGATYPLTVDPLMTSPAWEVSYVSEPRSVATAGDVNGDGYSDVIVGTYRDTGGGDYGGAFVYHGSATGLALTPAWTAESDQAGSWFASSVATAGDVNGDGYSDVIVGAYKYVNGQIDEGRAFVYHGSSAGLASSPAWTAESDQQGAYFGFSVATAGDVNGDGYSDVIVGAPTYDSPETNEGRVFVYYGSAAGLATTPTWTAESNYAGGEFGYSVATAGDVNGDGYSDVIVGARGMTNSIFTRYEGWAFAFHGSATGLSAAPVWIAEGNQENAWFGFSVATAGDVNGDGYSDVIVGSPHYSNGQYEEGRAFVYHGSAVGLASAWAWTMEGNHQSDYFAYAVATAGDVNGDGFSDVIVASVYVGGVGQGGGPFVYQGSAAGLGTSPTWSVTFSGAEFFGPTVATAGDVNGDGFSDAIIGGPYLHRACAYHGSAAGLASTAAWTAVGDQEGAGFGFSVATAGDVNGDGYSDVIVGAYAYDNGQSEEGRAFVYHGSAGGLESTPVWLAEGNIAGGEFGRSVATAGDVNGDGYSDVIVGSPAYSNGQGRAFVYCGSAAGLVSTPAWMAEGDQANAYFGWSAATAGDVNGDGYSDVIVGAYWYNNGEPFEGRAFVYHGSAAGLASTTAWIAEGNVYDAAFGWSVATAGDVNGDGYSDIIVGANWYNDEGRAYVYHGSAGGLALTPAWMADANNFAAEFGRSVATAGDVNGDGYSDVIVGAYWFSNGQSMEGRAFVYHGSSVGLASTPAWTAESDQQGAQFGCSVAAAGDVNGDGYTDVIVGANRYENPWNDQGRAYVYHGSASGLASTPAWTADGEPSTQFGSSVAMAADVNGDGCSDVIVGAPDYPNVGFGNGRARVYYGNGGEGLDRIPRQRRADDSAPIALLGEPATPSFRLRALGRSPGGRGRVRMELEVKSLGAGFNGTTTKGAILDTGTPVAGVGSAVPLNELVSGLGTAPYHWRLRILADSPFFPRSPWFSLAYNSPTETDLRFDSTVPATTTDLRITAYSTSPRSVTLSWTPAGDDGTAGQAFGYIVKKRLGQEITEANWATSTDIGGMVPGNANSVYVTGLSGNGYWYFALKATDEVANLSGVSNNDCIKFSPSPMALCEANKPVLAQGESAPVDELAIVALRPNPITSRDGAGVLFTLANDAPATLKVFDVAGRLVEAHQLAALGPGIHEIRIGERARLSSGLYWVRITQGGRSVKLRVVVVR